MTISKISQSSYLYQDDGQKILKFIKNEQKKLKYFENLLKNQNEFNKLTYSFDEKEIDGINTLLNSSAELLALMSGITKKIISQITIEESKDILFLQNSLMQIYNNYNYHLPFVKKFESWVKTKLN